MYSFEDIKTKIESLVIEKEFDLIVAIANGGTIPAALLQQKLQLPLSLLTISLRDKFHHPIFATPCIVSFETDASDKRILLVEDRVKTGATLQKGKQFLLDAGAVSVHTFAVNGKADYSLLDEPCFPFPWILS